VSQNNLDYIFKAKSVAVVGVSNKPGATALGGGLYLQHLLNCGFAGNIYPVNPKGGEVSNLKIYTSLKEIPEPVDFVICCIALKFVIPLIEECIATNAKALHIYTAGFSEYGTEEGKVLEEKMSSLARESGLRIIGPNCLGVYCPEAGLAFDNDVPTDSGTVGFVTQSGGNATTLIREASIRGIRFSKVVSYGNGCDVNESDLIEYLSHDPDTDVITVYIEGVKDGARFCEVLREATKKKPIIMLKGGIGEAGARAVVSHTGSLAGSDQVWSALFKQFGIVRVHSLEELIDMATTFAHLPKLSGNNVGLLCTGGGASVLATDICSTQGLDVPRFPKEMRDTLASFSMRGGVGLCLGNPVDLSGEVWSMTYDCAKTMLEYPGIDIMISQVTLSVYRNFFDGIYDRIINSVDELIRATKDSQKPNVLVVPMPISDETYRVATECRRKCHDAGIPVYNSLTSAAKSIAAFIDYHDNEK